MAQPRDMSFLSGGTPTALSHFSVCKFKRPWSPELAGCPSSRESLCPYKSSFELVICLLGQSVPLCVGKIILRCGLGSEEFRALAEQQEGGSDGWLPRGRTGAIGLVGDLRAGCSSLCYHGPWVWPWASHKSLITLPWQVERSNSRRWKLNRGR